MSSFEAMAVTGLACNLPGAADAAAFWRAIRDARVAPARSLEARWGMPRARYLGQPGDAKRTYMDTAFCLDTDDRQLDAAVVLASDVTEAALADASNGARPAETTRTALVVAMSWNVPEDSSNGPAQVLEGIAPRLGGPRLVVDTACASSLYALDLAAGLLHTGQADAVVVVGLNALLPPSLYLGFAKLTALSPDSQILPFAANASGLVPGEGAAAVVVEPLAAAHAAGRRVYGIVRGIGLAADGAERSVFAPGAAGQSLAYQRAYSNAGVDCAQVDYIEAHGTATVVGDATEIETLHGFFGPHRTGGAALPVGSVKALIGHTLAAAGMASLIKVLLMLRERTIPPHIGVDPHPALAETCLTLPVAATAWPPVGGRPPRVGISCFGFGGANAHAIVEADTDPTSTITSLTPTAPEPMAIVDVAALLPLPGELSIEAAGLRMGPNLLKRVDPLQLALTHLASELLGRNPSANGAVDTAVVVTANYRSARQPQPGSEPVTAEAIATAMPTMCSGYPAYHFNLRALHQTLAGGPATFATSLRLAPYWLGLHCRALLLGAAHGSHAAADTGAGLILLKSLAQAQADGDPILAILRLEPDTADRVELQQAPHAALGEATGLDQLVSALHAPERTTRIALRDSARPRLVLVVETRQRADHPPRPRRLPLQVTFATPAAVPQPPTRDTGALVRAWIQSEAAVLRAFFAAQRHALALLESNVVVEAPGPTVLGPVTRSSDQLRAQLLVDQSHPFFFDHPLDHVPGVLLLEGALQLAALHVPTDGDYFVRAVDVRFRQFTEKVEPVLVQSSAVHARGIVQCTGQLMQSGREVGTFRIELARFSNSTPGQDSRATPPPRPVSAALVHKQHAENVLVSELEYRNLAPECWVIPPAAGHLFATGNQRYLSPLYVLEAVRQAVILATHGPGGTPLGVAMNLLSMRLALQSPVPRGVPLRLRVVPRPARRLDKLVLGELQATLLIEDRPLGEALILGQVVDRDTYVAQRGHAA